MLRSDADFVWTAAPELNVTDLKQYTYCPRIPYYWHVLAVPRPVSYKMQHGTQAHIELDRLEKRRRLRSYGLQEGRRLFHLRLKSEALRLHGKLDLVIAYPHGDGLGYLPVEFKYSHGKAHANFKYQLAAYAMLLEEHYGVTVHEGVIYQIPTRTLQVIAITEEMRHHVRNTLAAIRRMIRHEAYPEPYSRRRCTDCEYRRYCNDID